LKYGEVVTAVAKEAGVQRREAARILQAFAGVLQNNVTAGHDVVIRNIGRFRRSFVAPGKRRSPTGEKLKRNLNVVNFKPSKSFRERMRKYDFQR